MPEGECFNEQVGPELSLWVEGVIGDARQYMDDVRMKMEATASTSSSTSRFNDVKCLLREVGNYYSSRIQTPEDAEDLAVEAAYRFLKKVDCSRSEADQEHLLWKIAKGVLNDYYRRQGRLPAFEDFEGADWFIPSSGISRPVEREIEEQELRHDLAVAVATLTRRHKEIVTLYLEGRSRQEMAEALGIDPKTVSNHWSSMLDELRALLSQHRG